MDRKKCLTIILQNTCKCKTGEEEAGFPKKKPVNLIKGKRFRSTKLRTALGHEMTISSESRTLLHRDTIDEIIDVRQRDLNHAAVVFRKKRPDFKAAP